MYHRYVYKEGTNEWRMLHCLPLFLQMTNPLHDIYKYIIGLTLNYQLNPDISHHILKILLSAFIISLLFKVI